MPDLDGRTRQLLDQIATVVRTTRTARRWSQRRLAAASGVSQTLIAKIERARVRGLSLRTAGRVLSALGVEMELGLRPPRIDVPAIRDAAHARCVAAVARRLTRAGFAVATEVEVGSGRWRGFIDVVAMHPANRLLLVWEVKTTIDDIGAVDRQLAGYLDAAWPAASSLGWRPRAVTGILAILATAEADRRLEAHRAYVDRAFPLRARNLNALVTGAGSDVPPRGMRGLAMIDPASRRRAWLQAATIDGRRSRARYADRAAYLSVARHTRLDRKRSSNLESVGPSARIRPNAVVDAAQGSHDNRASEARTPVGRI